MHNHSQTVVAVSVLRDTLTGIVSETVACGTITFPVPAAPEHGDSRAALLLAARMHATVSARPGVQRSPKPYGHNA